MLQKPFITFGEVLWDVFSNEKRLGGAPLNFAYYFKKSGGNPRIVSSIGKDALGDETLNKIKSLDLDCSYVNRTDRPTGRANVLLEGNRHRFEIEKEAAWGYIKYPDNKLIKNSCGIYFGTVARISQENRRTLDRLLEKLAGGVILLDLNLRQGFTDLKDIENLLSKINYLKMNGEEAIFLRDNRLVRGLTFNEMIHYFIKNHNLKEC